MIKEMNMYVSYSRLNTSIFLMNFLSSH